MPSIVGTGSNDKPEIEIKQGRYQIPRYPFDGPMPADAEPVEGVGMAVPWTRVSTLLDTHKNKEGIAKWRSRLIIKGLSAREDLVALAAATRLADKTGLDRVAEQAFDYAEGQSAANRGSALHGFLERHFEGDKSLVIPEKWRPDVTAVVSKFQRSGITIRPEYQELVVVRPDLFDGNSAGMAGRLDLVLDVPNSDGGTDLVIADYKTGSDPLLYGAWEIQQQGGAYGSMWACWDGRFWRPMPRLRRDFMLMIHVLPGQADVRIHQIHIDPEEVEADLAAAYRTRRRVKEAKKAHRLFDPMTETSHIVPAPAAPTLTAPPTQELMRQIGVAAQGAQELINQIQLPAFVPTPAAPTPDAAEQIRIGEERMSKISADMGANTDGDDADLPADLIAPEVAPDGSPLAPMAGPGKRGCSACGRTGHKKGSPKCWGDRSLEPMPDASDEVKVSQPVQVVEDVDPVPEPVKVCAHGSWTRSAEGGWHCAVDDCDAVAATGTLVPQPLSRDEVLDPDPFADDEIDQSAQLMARINQAPDKATIRAIRSEAAEHGLWTPEVHQAGLLRLETLNAAT